MRKLDRYLVGKKLVLNMGKSKILCFRKRGRKNEECTWKWKDEKVEEVMDIVYLGFLQKTMEVRPRMR